jgi:hypothetical protein
MQYHTGLRARLKLHGMAPVPLLLLLVSGCSDGFGPSTDGESDSKSGIGASPNSVANGISTTPRGPATTTPGTSTSPRS